MPNVSILRKWFILLAFLISQQTAYAGGVQVIPSSVVFTEGAAKVAPGSQIVLQFRANEYHFGSKKYAYLTFAVIPEGSERNQDSWEIYGALSAAPDIGEGFEASAKPYTIDFRAPYKPGKYTVAIARIPTFIGHPLKTAGGYKRAFVPHSADRALLSPAIRDSSRATLAHFEVSASPIPLDITPRVYLKLNGTLPSQANTSGGMQAKPLRFSWEVGPEFKLNRKHLLYRYRIFPNDSDWGAWTTRQQSSYSFLVKGIHQFSVQARFDDGNQTLLSVPATYQFNLDNDHISAPELKGEGKEGPAIAFDQVYAKSRALVIGVWNFDDKKFSIFDREKIARDVTAMDQALKRNGFEVSTLLSDRVTREDIDVALSKLIDSADRDDRLFIYFSTHGFSDPLVASEGYLATSDCYSSNPTLRCLRLNDLQNHAFRALDGKMVRQVLFAVDSCFSGLGIVRKSGAVPDLTQLAVPQGAFMVTAGMSDQAAQIDDQLKMSTFTHYLASGLQGEADLLGKNGVITLTELFLFVQYNVAQRTNATQIPMLGRMRGDGEMLFKPLVEKTR